MEVRLFEEYNKDKVVVNLLKNGYVKYKVKIYKEMKRLKGHNEKVEVKMKGGIYIHFI